VDIDSIISLVPVISIVATVLLGVFTWYTRRGNDRADAASTLTGSALSLVQALEKRVADVEKDLSTERTAREAIEIKLESEKQARQDLQDRATAQDATIAEQGAVIMQLRDTVEKQAVRIESLEKENGHLKAENIRLKSGNGSKI
jgi:uncharacterized protein (DUF3084 family)